MSSDGNGCLRPSDEPRGTALLPRHKHRPVHARLFGYAADRCATAKTLRLATRPGRPPAMQAQGVGTELSGTAPTDLAELLVVEAAESFGLESEPLLDVLHACCECTHDATRARTKQTPYLKWVGRDRTIARLLRCTPRDSARCRSRG